MQGNGRCYTDEYADPHPEGNIMGVTLKRFKAGDKYPAPGL